MHDPVHPNDLGAVFRGYTQSNRLWEIRNYGSVFTRVRISSFSAGDNWLTTLTDKPASFALITDRDGPNRFGPSPVLRVSGYEVYKGPR